METQVQAQNRARVNQPCAACKMLRRRCDNTCVLSPYFPIEEIDKFAGVHKIFGASNVIKMIQIVEEENREDAVKAMVYEASARLRDPIYGCAGTVFRLQKMVEELRSQLDNTTAQVSELRAYRDHLHSFLMDNVNYLETVPNYDLGDNYIRNFSPDVISSFGCSDDYGHVSFPF